MANKYNFLEPKSSYRVKVFKNNVLDKDIQRMFDSYHFILKFLLTPKYKIQGNEIVPVGKLIFIIWLILIIILFAICAYRASIGDIHFILNAINLAYYIFTSIGCFVMFICLIYTSQGNCNLIIIFQKIHRSINISDYIKTFIVWNYVSVFFNFVFNVVTIFIYFTICKDFSPIEFASKATYAVFDINVVYATRLLILLNKYLSEWIKCVNKLERRVENDDDFCLELHKSYLLIMKAYNLFKILFNILVREILIFAWNYMLYLQCLLTNTSCGLFSDIILRCRYIL